jgi:hypothetical protein
MFQILNKKIIQVLRFEKHRSIALGSFPQVLKVRSIEVDIYFT